MRNWRALRVAPTRTHHVLDGLPAYEARFREVLSFHEPGLAAVASDAGAFHIHPDGTPAYPERFQRTFGLYEGLAAVVSPEGWFHVHPDGQPAYARRYAWVGNFQGGFCAVRSESGDMFHVRPDGEPPWPSVWAYVGDFREGSAVVKRPDGLCTHIQADGTPLHGRWFLDLDVFHKGYALARDARGWFHVDAHARPLYADRYARAEPFYNGFALVERLDGAQLVIDERGVARHPVREPAERSAAPLAVSPSGRPQVGGFQLLDDPPLARTAWGTVRLAEGSDGRPAVVKSTRGRHDREWEVLQALRGVPGIPRALARAQGEQMDLLVLEHRRGSPVGGPHRARPASLAVAWGVCRGVLQVCAALHARGYAHTDLHPGNVLWDDEVGTTVLDYAAAVRCSVEAPWRGEINWGSWAFSPPEQLEDFGALDPRADVYAAAALFAEMVGGRSPFSIDVAAERRAGSWTRVREAWRAARMAPDLSALPPALIAPIREALGVNPATRPTATELLASLSEGLRRVGHVDPEKHFHVQESHTEWKIREELVRIGRLLYERGYNVSIDGNLSYRPDDGTLLMTPSGCHLGFLRPEDLVVTRADGTLLRGSRPPTSEVRLHVELHRARPDCRAVVHAHAPYAIAATLAGIELHKTWITVAPVPTTAYARISSEQSPAVLRPYLEQYNWAILPRHGVVAWAETPWDAFLRVESMEHCAKILVTARAAGPIEPLPEDRRIELLTFWGLEHLGEPS